MPPRVTLLALAVGGIIAFSGPPIARANLRCTTLRFPTTRSTEHAFFIGTTLPGTVVSGPGTVNDTNTSWPREARPTIRGYRVALERVGGPWRSLLPSGTSEIIL